MSVNQWHQYRLIVDMLKKEYGEVTPVLSEAEYNKKYESKLTIGMNVADLHIAYFLFKGSKTIANLANFRTMIQQSLSKGYKQILLFASEFMSSSIDKFIKSENEKRKNLIILKYTYHFNIEHGSGPFCGKHMIMTPEEIENEITKQQRISITDLKRIAQNDAQLQFLRVKVGDVIRIESISRNCGETIDYRFVTKPMEKGEALQNTKVPKSSEDQDDESEGSFEEDSEEDLLDPISDAESEIMTDGSEDSEE